MINIKGEHNMANKQLRETLSLDRVAFKERALNELKELNPCDKARAITECLDHFIKGRAWVDAINLDDITIMVTQSKGDDNTLVESVINQVSPRAVANRVKETVEDVKVGKKLHESLKSLKEDASEGELDKLCIEYLKNNYYTDEGDGYFTYEVIPYNDTFSLREIANYLEDVNTIDEFREKVDEAYDYYSDYYDEAEKGFEQFLLDKGIEDTDYDDIRDTIMEHLAIDADYDYWLNTEYPCHIFIDSGDGEYDFALNPSYSSNYSFDITDQDVLNYASLLWVAQQQGYTPEQVKNALDTQEAQGKFLTSVINEVANTSGDLNTFVILCNATVRQVLEWNNNPTTITINKASNIGLFDVLNGGGSVLDIQLEKPLVIPADKIGEFWFDEGVKNYNGYDVNAVYGLTRRAYDADITLGTETTTESLKEDYTWHSIDLGTEKAEKLKQFLRDNEIYFEPSSNGDLVHFEIKIDSDDVKDMINKYLDEGLTEGVKEPQEVNATLYYEEDGEPLLVFDTIATNDGKIEVFSFRDGHIAADQGYIDTLKKAKIDDRARALIKHYEDNYPVKVNLQEGLEERWVVFKFEEGNPYVAKTDEEKERILKKYEGRVEQLDDMAYFVKNKTVAEPVKEGYYDEMDEQYADILDKDVDVYDVKQYVLDGTDNKYRTHYTDKYAILVAPNGKGCVLDYEAVGQDFDNIDDKISFGIEENKDNEWVDEEGNKHTTINVMATHRINTTPKDVMEKAPKETMKFRDFFRKYKYNDRCSANFRGMVKYLKDNGYTGK